MTASLESKRSRGSSRVPINPHGPELKFYIPHKPVVRENEESTKMRIVYDALACEQALLGVGAGRGKRRELATMSQKFSFLRRKSRCKMLIGGY